MILAQTGIKWFMKSNSSADGLSINNMKTNRDSPYLYFYVVKARFKNCITFSSWISDFNFVFVSFDNCSFYGHVAMDALNNLFGSSHNITHVFLIRCTIGISGRYASFYIEVKDVESQIHIVQSTLTGNPDIQVIIWKTSAVQPVAHLTIHDSIINDTSINMLTEDSTAVAIVQITNTILTHTVVNSGDRYGYDSGQFAFFIGNCNFIQSFLNSYGSIIVYIVNSRFDVKCQAKGCAITITLIESNHVDLDISHINAMCELFQIKMYYGIYLYNIDFIGTESEAEFLTIEGSQAILENCTFSISTFVPIYVTQNLIFEDRSKIIHLINVNISVTEVKSVEDIPLFSINTVESYVQNVIIFCPKGFQVDKMSEKDNHSQYLCNDCQSDGYGVMGHSKLNSEAEVSSAKKKFLLK